MANINDYIKGVVESSGVELYDIENVVESGQNIFRVLIASPEGITIEKCTEISRILAPVLDVEYHISDKYFFEVSSPGVERKLTKISHFEKSIGADVKIKTTAGEELRGKLKNVNNMSICIEADKEEKCIEFDTIKKAKTFFVWK
jgi:ribosome maturation factor RimP